MRGFPYAAAPDDTTSGPGSYLVSEPDVGPIRPLYVQIADDLMAFLESEQRRRRLPGRPDVPKGVIVTFGLEAYRELVKIADELDSDAPVQDQVQALIALLHRCKIPIVPPRRGHK